MDAGVIAARIASGALVPLVKKLFVREGPGAGLVGRPVRISSLVSFTGEKRLLTEADLRRLTAGLLRTAVGSAPVGERLVEPAEEEAVSLALARTLTRLGDLEMDDVQAVRLGPQALAKALKAADGDGTRDLSADGAHLHDALLLSACLHILHFFTQRSTFVARTLVEHSGQLAEAIAKTDLLLARHPSPITRDTLFEERYVTHIAQKHGMLAIYGIDLTRSPEQWPLGTAYLSLEADLGQDRHHAMIRAEYAFNGRDRVLLRGVAGSGKTTLVQWLAVTTAQQDLSLLNSDAPLAALIGRVPFVLPMRTLTRQHDYLPNPDEFLHRTRSPLAGAQPAGWVDRVLSSGRGLLLIDGIDEVSKQTRERTRRWLQDLLVTYPGNVWLVTSRPSAVRDKWLAAEKFSELSLAPMSRQDVASFIHRWHNAARSVSTPEQQELLDGYEASLVTAVRTKKDLARLATNPLMCGLICALHCDRHGYLPRGRKELYEAALSMLLARRDRERDMDAPDGIDLTEDPKIRLLQRLAYKFILNGKSELDRSHAERIIADTLPSVPVAAEQGDAAAIFQHLLLRSGLLREPAVGSIDFIHRTFQDYLGAKAAVEEGDMALLVLRAVDSQWEDVVRMAVAHARPREGAELLLDLIRRGDSSTSTYRRNQLHLLATAAVEHATELEPRVRDMISERAGALIPPRSRREVRDLVGIGSVALELLPGPDRLSDEEALLTAHTAILIGGDAAIALLGRYNRHPDPRVRQLLCNAWHRFDTAAYAEGVLAGLLGSDVYFEVTTPAELAAFTPLGGRSHVRVSSAFDTNQLIQSLHPAGVTHLWLPAGQSVTWYWLAAFPRLETLTLDLGAETLDVSSLGAHPGLLHLRIAKAQSTVGLESLADTVVVTPYEQDPGIVPGV
ncbi:NACHT domain-containing protein [Streptomyces fructofermentans]|uniref:NACHT domain-containing protein n=1 Tax=Streptomyces fructofermentans TaxID=152141 RepID=UPI0016799481|nr:NACHT domain-containing protein [Streptomyces fructofermentans]